MFSLHKLKSVGLNSSSITTFTTIADITHVEADVYLHFKPYKTAESIKTHSGSTGRKSGISVGLQCWLWYERFSLEYSVK